MAASDVVYIVVNPSGGVASVFATEDQARADVLAVNDSRTVQPWVLRGGVVEPRRRSTDVRV